MRSELEAVRTLHRRYIEVAEVEEHGPARLPPAAKARLEADATARQQAYEEWGPPPQVLVYVGAGAATKVWVDRGDPPKAALWSG
jgi:hypothetical protein